MEKQTEDSTQIYPHDLHALRQDTRVCCRRVSTVLNSVSNLPGAFVSEFVSCDIISRDSTVDAKNEVKPQEVNARV